MLKKLIKFFLDTLIFVLVVIMPGSVGLSFFKIAAVSQKWWVGAPLIIFGFFLLLWSFVYIVLCIYALAKELE